MCVYIYIYVYMYIYICVCVYIYMCVYIYIARSATVRNSIKLDMWCVYICICHMSNLMLFRTVALRAN